MNTPSTPPTPPPQDTDRVCTAEEREHLDRLYEDEPDLKKAGIEEFDGWYVHLNEVTDACMQAWPEGDPGCSQSPLEYITHLINERNAVRATIATITAARDAAERKVGELEGQLVHAFVRGNMPVMSLEKLRDALGTEQAMHSAWRKRAEEAEATAATWQARAERAEEALRRVAWMDGDVCALREAALAALTPAAPSGNASGGAKGGE